VVGTITARLADTIATAVHVVVVDHKLHPSQNPKLLIKIILKVTMMLWHVWVVMMER